MQRYIDEEEDDYDDYDYDDDYDEEYDEGEGGDGLEKVSFDIKEISIKGKSRTLLLLPLAHPTLFHRYC